MEERNRQQEAELRAEIVMARRGQIDEDAKEVSGSLNRPTIRYLDQLIALSLRLVSRSRCGRCIEQSRQFTYDLPL